MGKLVKGQGRLVPGELIDARSEASSIVDRAREEASRILESARAEADRLRAGAGDIREAARREGHEAGRDAALAEIGGSLAAARAEAESIRVASRDTALALALRMAEKIVGRAVELGPSLLASIAGDALEESRARSGPVTLRVHPDDLRHVERERPALAARVAAGIEVRLLADESVGRAGCVIETPTGRLDARLSTQIDALARALGAGHGI